MNIDYDREEFERHLRYVPQEDNEMSTYNYTIIDSNGNEYKNLIGVFAKRFSIQVSNAMRNNRNAYVTYYGERYSIQPNK
jgi:hypothetical protein